MSEQNQTVSIPRTLLVQLTAILAAGEALVAPAPEPAPEIAPETEVDAPDVVPEPEVVVSPEPRPDVVLSAEQYEEMVARALSAEQLEAHAMSEREQIGAELAGEKKTSETLLTQLNDERYKQIELAEQAQKMVAKFNAVDAAHEDALRVLDERDAQLRELQAERETWANGTLLESTPAPAPWALLLRFAPLFIVALVAIVHTIYSSAVAGANMIAAIKYLIVGAAVGLLIDFMQHPDAQPEQLDGIGRNAAWTRRMWMMALCGIALAVRP